MPCYRRLPELAVRVLRVKMSYLRIPTHKETLNAHVELLITAMKGRSSGGNNDLVEFGHQKWFAS